jgi:hypothetical protein
MEKHTFYLAKHDGTYEEFYGTLEESAARSMQRAQRLQAYDVGQQLNALFDDIESGVFGEQAKTGKFYNHIVELKQRFPKP